MRRFWCERMVWARRCGGWVLSRLVCVGEFKAMSSDFLFKKKKQRVSRVENLYHALKRYNLKAGSTEVLLPEFDHAKMDIF